MLNIFYSLSEKKISGRGSTPHPLIGDMSPKTFFLTPSLMHFLDYFFETMGYSRFFFTIAIHMLFTFGYRTADPSLRYLNSERQISWLTSQNMKDIIVL